MSETGRLVGEDWTSFPEFIGRVRGDEPARIIRPEALWAIERAQTEGCKTAILSNELDLFYGANFRNKLPFLSSFDTIIDATYTKILKPDPRAFSMIISQLGIAPENCVFVDDQLKNIRGGEDAGMLSIHFDVTAPKESYRRALRALGIDG